MALTPGTRLGPYEVTAEIGKGGMGEVYRATDTKLKRQVAIKVLPAAVASDPERLARFQREAEVLASLNHPNIAAIHGLEESGGVKALVMELVDGPTLADRIAQGAMPLDEAVPVAKQIAEALEAAHEQSIIHRDLKPANVKLRPDGAVKVLDFGLAKAMEPTGASSANVSMSPTISMQATQAGVILGTAAYMSPEQARGKPVDKRTDIWAFGCVFYEMLTGKQAFPGENVTETLASVLKSEPDWRALPRETPSSLLVLLRRCLQKDIQQRFKDAGDIRIQLEEIKAAVATAKPVGLPKTPLAAARRRTVLWAASCLAAALIAGIIVWTLRPAPAPQALARLVVPLKPNEQLANASAVAVSPDGAHLVYAVTSGSPGAVTTGSLSSGRLYLRALDSLEARLIAETTGPGVAVFNPFFSPDGQWIAFFADGKLKKISVSGGAALTLCDAPAPAGGTWGPDDNIIFAPTRSDGLWQVSSAGGAPQKLTTLEAGESSHRWPQILPDGKGILFTVVPKATADANEYNVAVQTMDKREKQILIRSGSYGRYAPAGYLVYYRAGTMMAAPFDLARLEVKGNARPVVEGVGSDLSGLAQFSFSSLGSLVYASGRSSGPQSAPVFVDRKGVVQPLSARPGVYDDISLSPDGRRVALAVGQSSGSDVWIYDITRDTLTRLTFDGVDALPRWTPDGKRIVFSSGIKQGLFWKPVDSSAPEELLTAGVRTPGSVSPDGRFLVYSQLNPKTKRDLWIVPLEGERKPQPFLQTPFNETGARFSLDGRWLAYFSDQSGKVEVYVRPFPGPGGEVQISTGGATSVVGWSNGELFYRAGERAEKMMAVEAKTQPTLSVGKPRLLFEGPYARTSGSVTADGQRFLLLKLNEQEEALPQITVVLNWFEELKRRVPAR